MEKKLGHAGEAIRDHLPKMAALANSANTDLKKRQICFCFPYFILTLWYRIRYMKLWKNILLILFTVKKMAERECVSLNTYMVQLLSENHIKHQKAVIEQARLQDKQLEFKIVDDGLLIQPVKKNREGWKEQFDKAFTSRKSGDTDQEWLDAPLAGDEDWE